ncbi:MULTISPECIES: heme o synthase [Glutamicibacter]|jgi:protoheme IX farnesyltransferase|uniref:Protoheme IX farnesyltransferase n=2 Tax=Glutamicibacter arilaitensis TaxID=256701 RepID=A0A2N7S3N2_9MICC|nr:MULTISPECIES: heme o synthase [Glutamicibacter]PMQ20724.1 protoheme IX farnesyltransferase [Glutamicibacter arilaitensis]TFH56962.1 protoheme IX farnesyltransferase [Glutamicibacter arilaitensis]CBT76106.1 protoheme IX farnesyltransferase [Glutamicibacter arilaitensis Re117]HCH47595.1 protoheme IX farnesyltransferase [Glutamicibacter sp.]HCJ55070.1 protoheme IX farnesyltransferase [Glutamicibacter sp.]
MKRKALAYLALTKPRVIELLLVSTLPTMIFAERGFPAVWLMISTLVGGAMAAGASGAFNCYIDRDMDKLMKRTKGRPLVTGDLTPKEALIFSWSLAVASLIVLWVGTNPLTTALGLAAILLYVVFYTLILKRRTAQNIVWGGIAGCMPVLIAWAAVKNTIEWPAVILFLVIFLWTPPHYWPLSMKYADDYNAASVPMLGAIANARRVSVQVVLYAWATVVCSMLLVPLGNAGILYTAIAGGAGIWFVYESHVLYREAQGNHKPAEVNRKAMKVFHISITYLTIVFLALAVDPFVGSPLFG